MDIITYPYHNPNADLAYRILASKRGPRIYEGIDIASRIIHVCFMQPNLVTARLILTLY